MTKSPTKRASPRKKAWASPKKSPMKAVRNIFADDLAPLDKSWAEITEEESLAQMAASQSSPRRSTRRKPHSPKRANPKPRFEKSLELTEALASQGLRRSERNSERRIILEETRMELIETVSTIEMNKSRKRHMSSSSTITDGGVEPPSPSRRGVATPSRSSGRPARKNVRLDNGTSSAAAFVTTSAVHSSPCADFKAKDFWEQPSLGWCQDMATIERREKEIAKAKEKPVYERYLREIPKNKRQKGVHPRTPNKLINYSRRSWDTQMRNWKRSLYSWAGEEPSESANTSFCSSNSEDDEKTVDTTNVLGDLSNKEVKIPSTIRTEADSVASMMGHFDLDTRTLGAEDDSTIKAHSKCVGPTDFSNASIP